jgi:hypothetical protein
MSSKVDKASLNELLSRAKTQKAERTPVEYLKLDGLFEDMSDPRKFSKYTDRMQESIKEDLTNRNGIFGEFREWEEAQQALLPEDEREKALHELVGSINYDYCLIVSAMHEKKRLTVDWNDTAKMTEKERVRATAHRVGLKLSDERDP